jgi:hypothetical protein
MTFGDDDGDRPEVLSLPPDLLYPSAIMWGVWKSWSLGMKAGAIGGGLGFALGAVVGIAAGGWIGVGFVVAIVALFAGGFGYAYAPEVRRNRLAGKGIPAEATIVSTAETGWTVQSNYGIARVLLRVEPPDGGEPYEVTTRIIINRFDYAAYRPGERIAVLIDPRDRGKVVAV